MAPCEGCIALKNESAALKERVAELEQSNRDLRLIRKEEDKLEALHTTLCNPSFLGTTLPWDSSDSLPDVEPELRAPPTVDRVLGNGPLALTHSGVANVASSTPLPNLPTEAGLGSVSIRHHDLHGPMVAAPSLRRATSLPALLSPLASPDPAPAGDKWHLVVRSKRGSGFHRPLALLSHPPPPFPTHSHFEVLTDYEGFPSPSSSSPPGGARSRRRSGRRSGPGRCPRADARWVCPSSPLRPLSRSRSGPGSSPSRAARRGPRRSLAPAVGSAPLGSAGSSASAFPSDPVSSPVGPLPVAPPAPAETSAGSMAPTSEALMVSAGGAAGRPVLSGGLPGPTLVMGSAARGSPGPIGPLAVEAGPTQVAGPGVTASAGAPEKEMLILGSSHVRHVRIRGALTHSISGATVKDIIASLPDLLRANPRLTSVAIHVGANDIRFKQSITLEDDFRNLIQSVTNSGLSLIISGPFISPRHNDEQFSRLLALHVWLRGYCCSLAIPYVDNYAFFSGRRGVFEWDGRLGGDRLHLNGMGAQLLSRSIALTVQSAAWNRPRKEHGPSSK